MNLAQVLHDAPTAEGELDDKVDMNSMAQEIAFDGKIPLQAGQNQAGAIYVGKLSISGQPVNVIFDTGSDYLAVTSSLCGDMKYGSNETSLFDESAKADQTHLLVDAVMATGFLQLDSEISYRNDDLYKNKKSAAQIEKETAERVQESLKRKPRCNSQAYVQTNDSVKLHEDEVSLAYGSAQLNGYLF